MSLIFTDALSFKVLFSYIAGAGFWWFDIPNSWRSELFYGRCLCANEELFTTDLLNYWNGFKNAFDVVYSSMCWTGAPSL